MSVKSERFEKGKAALEASMMMVIRHKEKEVCGG